MCLIVYMCILQLSHITRTYALIAGGTNIDSDKRAMNKDNLDIIVGTPGITPFLPHTHVYSSYVCVEMYALLYVHTNKHAMHAVTTPYLP